MGKNISLEWLENSKNYQVDTNTSLLLQCHGLASDIDYAVSEVMQNLYGDKGEEIKEAKICHETIDKVKESLLDLVKITIDESMASKQNHNNISDMTAKVKINDEERIAILFPFYDTDDCVEAMAEAMWQVTDTIVSCEESKSMISANALNQLMKLNKMLRNDPE